MSAVNYCQLKFQVDVGLPSVIQRRCGKFETTLWW